MPVYETASRLELRDRAQRLSDRFVDRRAEEILAENIGHEFNGKIGLVSSFGAEAAVLLHMVANIKRDIPIVFLDTFKHFPETLAYRDELVQRLDLRNLIVATAQPASIRADDPTGELHQSNPDLCCHVRKTLPLQHALHSMQCWITGRKRFQTSDRAALDLFEVQNPWIKLNPLIEWTTSEIDAYFAAHDLPAHPLKAQGYLSIGCQPCTRVVSSGENVRDGRWANSDKTECGIHILGGQVVRA